MVLTYPAPKRCSYEIPGGGFATRAWGEQDVREYRAAGGWFISGKHDFETRAAARLATGRDETDGE